MENDIDQRVIDSAKLFLTKCSTVREVAKLTGFSKSTVHKDLNERLANVDEELYMKVRKLLEYNKQVRHIRGGMATKKKYQNK